MGATVTALIEALSAGLSIWKSKESRRYTDELLKLQRDYYEAYNAEPRDNAKLDHAEHKLCDFARIVSAEIRAKEAGNQPA